MRSGAKLGLSIFTLIILVVGGTFMTNYIVRSKKAVSNHTNIGAKPSAKKKLSQKLTLFNHKVSLAIPNNWSVNRQLGHCMTKLANGEINCLEEVFVSPSAGQAGQQNKQAHKPPFAVSVVVFRNPDHQPAKTWFEQDLGYGNPATADVASDQTINDYDAYYRKQKSNAADQSFEQLFYVLSTHDHIVLLRTVVYDLTSVSQHQIGGNFQQYEATIADIAQTIRFH